MMKSYFKRSYYLNAMHSSDQNIAHKHYHSFYLTLYIAVVGETDFIPFFQVDEKIKEYLSQYWDTYLNELEPFRFKPPTVENMGDFFYEEIKVLLKEMQLDLMQLEISETPVRVYAVSDCILIPSQHSGDNKRIWNEILEKKKRILALYRKMGESYEEKQEDYK